MTEERKLTEELIETLKVRIRSKIGVKGHKLLTDAVKIVGGRDELDNDQFSGEQVLLLLEIIRVLEEQVSNILRTTGEINAANNVITTALTNWATSDVNVRKEQANDGASAPTVQPHPPADT